MILFIFLSLQVVALLATSSIDIPSEIKKLGYQHGPTLTYQMIDNILNSYMGRGVDPCVARYSLYDVKTHFDFFISARPKLFAGHEIALYEFLVTSFVYTVLPEKYQNAISRKYYEEVIDEKTCSSNKAVKFPNSKSQREFLTRVGELNNVLPSKEFLLMVCQLRKFENIDRKHFENTRDFPQSLELIIANFVRKEILQSLEDHRVINVSPIVKHVIPVLRDKPEYKFWISSMVGNKILDCQIVKILQYEFLKAVTAKPAFNKWIYTPNSISVEKSLNKASGFNEFMRKIGQDSISFYYRHEYLILSFIGVFSFIIVSVIAVSIVLRVRRQKKHKRLAPVDEDMY